MGTMVGLANGTALETLKRMGMQAYKFSEFKEIKSGCIVIIYDANGIIDLDILNYLINNACDIKYIYEEGADAIEKYLISQNVFDIYSDKSEGDLTSDFILDIAETHKTKTEYTDTSKVLSSLNSINVCTQLVTELIEAIDKKDKDKLQVIFEKDFEKIKDFSNLYADEIAEKENMRRAIIKKDYELEEAKKEVEKMKNVKDNIVKSGQELQQDNKLLAEAMASARQTISDKEDELKNLQEELAESSLQFQALNKENEENKKKIAKSSAEYNQLKLQQDSLLKQIDNLQDTLRQASFTTESLTVTLTNTYSVNRILYLKCIDMVPYLINSLTNYLRYAKNALGSCGLIIVANKGSLMLKKYKSKFKQLTEETNSIEDNEIYYMEDYSLAIENYIRETKNKNVIILDLTFKDLVFIKSVRMKVAYIINNKDTLDIEGLNPADCISYSDLTSSGVIAHIPYISPENATNKGKVASTLRMTLFSKMDRWWA